MNTKDGDDDGDVVVGGAWNLMNQKDPLMVCLTRESNVQNDSVRTPRSKDLVYTYPYPCCGKWIS